jgi:hypothetical protein
VHAVTEHLSASTTDAAACSTSPESPTTAFTAPVPATAATAPGDDYPRPTSASADAPAVLQTQHDAEAGYEQRDEENAREGKKKGLKHDQARNLQKEHGVHAPVRKSNFASSSKHMIQQPAQKQMI